MISISTFILGPVQTNTYLVIDNDTGSAVVIDPAWKDGQIIKLVKKLGVSINYIWLTHAHFDHFAGVADLISATNSLPPVGLHPEDLALWQSHGGAPIFGFNIEPGPRPTISFFHQQILKLGNSDWEVRWTPGHTQGHVVFYSAHDKLLFSGDLIIQGGIGRTDLPGGNYYQLIDSINTQILSLPDEIKILPGHGFATTVGDERRYNPFIND